MKKLILILLLALLACPPVFAEATDDVKKLAHEKINRVMELLATANGDKVKRNAASIDAVEPIFDFRKMAVVSLGRKYWRQMSKEQKKEFNDLFVKRLQESYLEKLDLYTDEKVTIDEASLIKTKSGRSRIYVMTHLVSADDKKEMIYRFYKKKSGWKVYDVVILGVSVVQTYRSQFAGILKKGSIEDLLVRLRKQGEFTVPTGAKS